MTPFPFVYFERTRTPNLRPMTAEVQSHSQQSRVSSVANPDCLRLDICRWENEGGALIGDKRPPAAVLNRKDNPSRCSVGMAPVGFEVPDRVAFVATHDRLLRAGMPITIGDNGISWVMRFGNPQLSRL